MSPLLLCLAVVAACCCCLGAAGTDVFAVAIEYAPLTSDGRTLDRTGAQQLMLKNLAGLESQLAAALESRPADLPAVAVFPEDGLYGAYAPAPRAAARRYMAPYLERMPTRAELPVVPCGSAAFDDRPVLQAASCVAARHRAVVVLDAADEQPCGKEEEAACPGDGRWQFNTAVAFNASGAMVAKYHKTHLYGELQWDSPPTGPDAAWFELWPGGPRAGLLVCFDINFAQPQTALLQQHNVSLLLFPSWWVNFPPLDIALLYQQGWARYFARPLIAADSGSSGFSSGSGIYDALGRPLAAWFNPGLGRNDSHPLTAILDVPEVAAAALLPPPPPAVAANRPEFAPHNATQFAVEAFALQSAGAAAVQSNAVVCTAAYTAAATNDLYYGVAALGGRYHGLFPASICSFLVCFNATLCAESGVIATNASLSAVRLQLDASNSPLGLPAPIYAAVTLTNGTLAPYDAWRIDYGTAANATATLDFAADPGLPVVAITLWGLHW